MITEKERQEIESTVKELLLKSISSKLIESEIKERGIAEFDVVNKILTDVMALGYNNHSKELATSDIWEIQSQLPLIVTTKLDISKRLEKTSVKYNAEIDSFILMVNGIKNGDEKEKIIERVINHLKNI